jgi:hypothetical protein
MGEVFGLLQLQTPVSRCSKHSEVAELMAGSLMLLHRLCAGIHQ